MKEFFFVCFTTIYSVPELCVGSFEVLRKESTDGLPLFTEISLKEQVWKVMKKKTQETS